MGGGKYCSKSLNTLIARCSFAEGLCCLQVDMVRKLFLVGLVLMFGRGTSLQLGTTCFVATLFMLAHTRFVPYKLSQDNLLRGTTELHTLFTILLAALIKRDGDDESSRAVYDVVAVATFVGLVALPFVVIVGLQLRDIQTLMQDHLDLLRGREADSSAAAGTTAVDLGMAIRRHELGLQSSVDRQTVLEYFDDPSPGMEVWKDKTIVTHLAAHELQALLDEEEAQLPKSQSFGLHFTDLDSARLILTSLGIRASTVGQLNGKYCSESLNTLIARCCFAEGLCCLQVEFRSVSSRWLGLDGRGTVAETLPKRSARSCGAPSGMR